VAVQDALTEGVAGQDLAGDRAPAVHDPRRRQILVIEDGETWNAARTPS